MLKIGSHISFKSPRYLVGAIEESIANGANTMMIYLGPPQSTNRVSLEKYQLEEYMNMNSIIKPQDIVVHAPYILNLANKNKSSFSKDFLIKEIERMNYIGAKYLVLHPGAHLNFDVYEAIDHLCENLIDILQKTSDVEIILETMAGKGSEIGKTLEQLQYMVQKINHPRIGICLDTCHLWDGGYDLKDDFENNDGKNFINQLEKLDLLRHVKVIHLNDSKNPLGSAKDRHENIGKGYIGLKALKNFANHPKFANIPVILETPYVDDKPIYDEEIKLIKS